MLNNFYIKYINIRLSKNNYLKLKIKCEDIQMMKTIMKT